MTSDLDKIFVERWQELTYALGIESEKAREVGDYLLAQYSHPDRHYHSVRHIVSMLDGFHRIEGEFMRPLTTELAIFFHDVIYDPARPDNEARSAEIMQQMLEGHVDSCLLADAAFTINATCKHAATGRRDTDLMIDLDMAILGQPWAVYARYAEGVMKEYLPVFGEEAYRLGRPERFLKPTIAKEQIFITPEFRHLDAPARRNMAREMQVLAEGQSFSGPQRG